MTEQVTKSAALRRLITSPVTEFLIEAHSGISARIGEEAGFAGIWASGLGISAQCGVRDNNELSWTQVLEILELMSDATTVPILLDGDTGYGDFNSVRRLVRKVEQSGGAGVCIEDKLFPKTNSFIQGERQPLADVDEFCGKIKAAKDSQRDPDFCMVARVEALIAGWGVDEALRRAEAYQAAGADAILIHSKRPDADEIAGVRAALGPPAAADHRAHHLLQHADRGLPARRSQRRDLGESPDPRVRRRDAARGAPDPRRREPGRGRGPDRAGGRDLPAAGRGRAARRREALHPGGSAAAWRRDPGRLARRGARGAHRRAPEGHAGGGRQAAAAAPGGPLQGGGRPRDPRRRRLQGRGDRRAGHPAAAQSRLREQRRAHHAVLRAAGLRRRQRDPVRRPAVPQLHAARSPEPLRPRHGGRRLGAPARARQPERPRLVQCRRRPRAVPPRRLAPARLARAPLAGARARRALDRHAPRLRRRARVGEGRARDPAGEARLRAPGHARAAEPPDRAADGRSRCSTSTATGST